MTLYQGRAGGLPYHMVKVYCTIQFHAAKQTVFENTSQLIFFHFLKYINSMQVNLFFFSILFFKHKNDMYTPVKMYIPVVHVCVCN